MPRIKKITFFGVPLVLVAILFRQVTLQRVIVKKVFFHFISKITGSFGGGPPAHWSPGR